ncbi:MAG: hypothetical protein KGJ84_15595 [Elusimicrobia bacterium]|nr:hypothetical protein [Elusimicrobiota bacterium]
MKGITTKRPRRVPPRLTKDGSLYLVVGDHGDAKTFTAAKEMAGQDAKLAGCRR